MVPPPVEKMLKTMFGTMNVLEQFAVVETINRRLVVQEYP